MIATFFIIVGILLTGALVGIIASSPRFISDEEAKKILDKERKTC